MAPQDALLIGAAFGLGVAEALAVDEPPEPPVVLVPPLPPEPPDVPFEEASGVSLSSVVTEKVTPLEFVQPEGGVIGPMPALKLTAAHCGQPS